MDNKQVIIEHIWNDPARVFGCDFQRGTTYQTSRAGGDYTEKGKIRLKRTPGGITVYYNGDSREQSTPVLDYLQRWHLNTADFWETLQRCAEIYGVNLELSKEAAEKIKRQRLAAEVAPSFIYSLSEHPDGLAATYLRNVRKMEPDARHFGELTAESIQRAKDSLKARNIAYDEADWEALRLTVNQANKGYNLIIPYYHNGAVVAFLFRDVTGKASHKYDFPNDLPRGYFCDPLTYGEKAYIVEGEIDALRLMAAGIPNVIAMSGAKMGADLARLLETYDIHDITYIPDTQYNKDGEKETKLTNDAIKAFQDARDSEGERLIKHLYIAEIPTPKDVDLAGYKIDADDYGKENGPEALRTVVNEATEWWDYKLAELEDWTTRLSKEGKLTSYEFENRFLDIYNRVATPLERERIRQNIDGIEPYKQCGITRASLLDVDEMQRHTEFNERVKAAASDLDRAIKDGVNPVKVAEAATRLSNTLNINTRDEWDKQISASFAERLEAIKDQPETLQTFWDLGDITKNGTFIPYEKIEFFAADITVFCAPTSHGKTMVLFQSAINLAQRYPNKTFLYVSCEENNRQLLERAINVFMDIETTEDGIVWDQKRNVAQNYCFIRGTRKRAIKAILRGDQHPAESFTAYTYTTEHWERLKTRVKAWITKYEEQIDPRLRLVHTEGSAESIAANVNHYVAQMRDQDIEIGGVFVDYMQLLTSDGGSYSRHDELKDVCKALKDCAARTNLPIIIAAQLNRDAIKAPGAGGGVDSITVANIGEGADIERIAHDIFLIWQVDKTKQDGYINAKPDKDGIIRYSLNVKDRSRRIFYKYEPMGKEPDPPQLKKGHLYIEQMKARDGKTEGWGLFPFDGERGSIGPRNEDIMKQ